MRISAFVLVSLVALWTPAAAQSTCVAGGTYMSGSDVYYCTGDGMSVQMAKFADVGGTSIQTGLITLVVSGGCPTGWSEAAALNGRMLRGTLATNGDVGTTGGSDAITPAGTNTVPAFTGNSVASSLVSAGTPAGTNGTAVFTPVGTVAAPTFTGAGGTVPAHTVSWPAGVPTYTGTVNTLAVTAHAVVATKQGTAAGNIVTTATHAITGIPGGTVAWPAGVPTMGTAAFTPAGTNTSPVFTGTQGVVPAQVFTGSALGTHQHTTTATGTNTAPVFTGTGFDNRSAYLNVIFCQKD